MLIVRVIKQNSKVLKLILLAVVCVVLLFYGLFGCFDEKTSESGKILEKNLVNIYEKHLSRCGRFPNNEDLNITNKYWQVTNTSNGTFYLFNAYYDDREVNGSVVRILGMINRINPTVETYCQMWFDGNIEPIPVKVHQYRSLWPEYWGQNTGGATPNLISCKSPFGIEGPVPSHVSLVEEKCSHANNIFAVINNRLNDRKRKSFLVCWRGAHFEEDISLMVIEWAEILKKLGVDNVVVYIENVHPNVMKVLQYYSKSEFFIIKFMEFPHHLQKTLDDGLLQCVQNELVSYHDALFENLYAYEFMVPMDIDEFIMPLPEGRTWKDVIRRTDERFKDIIIDAYQAIPMSFILKSPHQNETIKGIPKQLRFLSNIYRAKNFSDIGTKAFMRMDRVYVIHNHYAMSCVNTEWCHSRNIDVMDGELSHYRADCNTPECKESMSNPVKDTTLWQYKDEILENIGKALKGSGLRVELSIT